MYLCEGFIRHSCTVTLHIYSGDRPIRSSKVKGRFKLSEDGSQHVHDGNTSWHVIPEQPVAPVLSGE